MSQLSNILELEEESIRRKAQAHRQFANYQSEQGGQIALAKAATYYLSSALYTSIFSPREAIDLISKATQSYEQFHHPFSIICHLIEHRGEAPLWTDRMHFIIETPEAYLYQVIYHFANFMRNDKIGEANPSYNFEYINPLFIPRTTSILGSTFDARDIAGALMELANNRLRKKRGF
jgi:hypothetical protein